LVAFKEKVGPGIVHARKLDRRILDLHCTLPLYCWVFLRCFLMGRFSSAPWVDEVEPAASMHLSHQAITGSPAPRQQQIKKKEHGAKRGIRTLSSFF
jgi:hypothetical protein